MNRETKYGFLNGVPIDPGEGWEIVPWDDKFTTPIECQHPGCAAWHNYIPAFVCCTTPRENWDNHRGDCLTFRRPKQTVQTGQGESEAKVLSDEQRDYESIYMYWHERDKGDNHSIYEWLDGLVAGGTELTKLRTLTAAQSVALEKAEGMLRSCRFAMDRPVPFPSLEKLNEALTLIQQAKEVGK